MAGSRVIARESTRSATVNASRTRVRQRCYARLIDGVCRLVCRRVVITARVYGKSAARDESRQTETITRGVIIDARTHVEKEIWRGRWIPRISFPMLSSFTFVIKRRSS